MKRSWQSFGISLALVCLFGCGGGKGLTPLSSTFSPMGPNGAPPPASATLPQPVSVSLTANDLTGTVPLADGGTVTVAWNATNATICSLTINDNQVVLSSSTPNTSAKLTYTNVKAAMVFRVSCANAATGEQGFNAVSVAIQAGIPLSPPPPGTPSINLTVSNTTNSNVKGIINHPYNTPVILRWGPPSESPDSCVVSDGKSSLSTNFQSTGFTTANLVAKTIFGVTCYFSGNRYAMDFVTVSVAAPPAAPVEVVRTIFATSVAYRGNLGGLAGADAKCLELANAVPALSGKTWKAILSTRYRDPATQEIVTIHAKDRIQIAPTDKIRNLNPNTANRDVATGQTLFTEALFRAVDFTEKGTAVQGLGSDQPGYEDIWSASGNDGMFKSNASNVSNEACQNWGGSSSSVRVVVGSSTRTGSFLDYVVSGSGSDYSDCGEARYFYCISQ